VQKPQKVWGIGFGRTGTSSLIQAFKRLGFRRVKQNPRFEELKDLDAAADNGCAVFYKYLDHKFPGSKFVLTVRDLDAWLEAIEFIINAYPISRNSDVGIQRRMLLFETVRFERDKMVKAYMRHHADVRRYFMNRPADLLEMDITKGDGWRKLCPFLGVPILNEPFPHLNQRSPAERLRARVFGARSF